MKSTYKKTLFVALFSVFFESLLTAQSFAELGDKFEDPFFKLFLRGTSVKPGNDGAYGGITINGSLSTDSYEKWGSRVRYENPTLGDLVFLLARLINGKKATTNSGLEHAYGSGFFGWVQFYKNAITKDKFILSPGITAGDYIFGIEKFDSNGTYSSVYTDPIGYYFSAGPALMGSYLIGAGFWADAYVNYDICYGKVKYSRPNYTAVPGYKKPHFITWGFDINHKSRIFGGLRFNHVIDRGSYHVTARRMDVSVGYHF